MSCIAAVTTTASDELNDVLWKWKEITKEGNKIKTTTEEDETPSNVVKNDVCTIDNGRKMTLVVLGRAGAGKSSLIGNMLGEQNEQKGSDIFESTIEGVRVQMVDTPSLGKPGRDDKSIFHDLISKTENKADMLLYCLDFVPSSKIDAVEVEIMKKLTSVFGKDIWKRVIVVLTFANVLMNNEDAENVKSETKAYARCFQQALKNYVVKSFSAVSVFDSTSDSRSPNEIPVLPAGQNQQEQFVGTRWDVLIYQEVNKKCKHDTTPELKHGNSCVLQ